jgi:exopolysaccharide biosynthesis polyprenyl glycosylphosphotransferase
VLHRYGEVFRSFLMLADLLLVAACWTAAYGLRFTVFWDEPAGSWKPGFSEWMTPLLGIVPLVFWMFRSRGLYRPQRTGSLLREVGLIVGGMSMAVVGVLAADAALRTYHSRLGIGFFWALGTLTLVATRVLGRGLLRSLRRRGYNLRYVLIAGAGELAAEVIEAIHTQPEAGLRILGVLSDDPTKQGKTIEGVRVLGPYAAVKEILRRRPVDEVVLALPREDAAQLEKILADLDDELVTVRLIPDLLHVMTLRSSVEELDGLPLINLRESPMVGWAAVQKRAFDALLASALLLAFSPLLLLAGLAVWAGSGRPILYGQERMGLDGRVFRMLKFRTMRRDAERETGPVWTSEHDPRRTRLGALLRRTSVDELPQLWNVVRGDMSLVGPRPERPVFIERFRREIPGYMLRHKVRAGLTGWAQVHGWRGDTSLHERVEHDIYYIQNWSLALDLRILLMTIWRGWFHRNAY